MSLSPFYSFQSRLVTYLLNRPRISKLYKITLCTSFALMCSLRQVKLLAGYGWDSSNQI